MTKVTKRKTILVKSLKADYHKTRSVGHIRPKPLDPQAYSEAVQSAHKPEDTRTIAKFLASSLPLEGEEWGEAVTAILGALDGLTKGKRNRLQTVAIRTAYRFAKRVPMQERKDMFDSLYLSLMQQGLTDVGLAHSVAMHDWADWWRAYKIRSHYSLEALTVEETTERDMDGHAMPAYGRYLIGVCDFEEQILGKVTADSLMAQLPDHIRTIVQKRLEGHAGSKREQWQLRRWVSQRPTILAQYMSN